MSIPKTQTAVFVKEIGKPLVIGPRDVPIPKPHHILIKVQSTMLLPHDTYGRDKGLFFGEHLPFIIGHNIAGTVVSVGSAVESVNVGDDVFGLGSPVSPVPDESGLQQYALLDAECSAKIPTGYDFDQMASIPVNATTSAAAIFNEKGFGFPMPGSKKAEDWDPKSETILVIGGGSNVGKIAIQYGKLLGLGKILTVASASNTSALKELGATHVIDRHQTSSEIQAQIKDIVGSEGLSKIYDCVSWEHEMALALLSPDKPGILLGLHPVDEAKKIIAEKKLNVKATLILGITSFLQPLTKPFWELLPSLVANGNLVIGKYKAIEGFNLAAIEEALDSYRDGSPVTPAVVHP
ncbi:hypothetical protein EAE96_002230 [Botrytis aclada]|nr:hypothetical protein EAE96_002230 [Botrytis aclada]